MILDGILVNPEVRIENTNICNARCVICPREKMTRPRAIMGFEHFESLVDEVCDLGATAISVFGFGEPLVDKGLCRKIDYCSSKGLRTSITTNASLLTDGVSDNLIEAGLTEIRFSVHGFADSYEKVHCGLSFETTMKNIMRFLQKKHDIIVNVSVIPMHGENVEEIVWFWEPIVDFLEVWRPHNWTDGRDYRVVAKRKKTCGRPHNGPIQINADGKMMVCCFDYNAVMEIGDTKHHFIKDILTNGKLLEIQKRHSDGDLGGLLCENCDQLNEYSDEDYPLLYSNRDPLKEIGKTSTFKIRIGD